MVEKDTVSSGSLFLWQLHGLDHPGNTITGYLLVKLPGDLLTAGEAYILYSQK
jgi:hypothetical protein